MRLMAWNMVGAPAPCIEFDPTCKVEQTHVTLQIKLVNFQVWVKTQYLQTET